MNVMLHIDILTLFPEYFPQPLEQSIVGRALKNQQVEIKIHPLRKYGLGKHKVTDDRPYGGGAGMVLLVEPIHHALIDLGYQKGTSGEIIILTSAKGKMFNQNTARSWSKLNRICIVCGHYEGVDERVSQHLVDEEVRIGNYVLTGGEPAALVITDSLTRLQPEVLGNTASLQNESHDNPGQLGYPQYSRPSQYEGWKIPSVLQSGNHELISKWREKQVTPSKITNADSVVEE